MNAHDRLRAETLQQRAHLGGPGALAPHQLRCAVAIAQRRKDELAEPSVAAGSDNQA